MAATVEELQDELGTLRLPRKYVPVEPHAKQEWFLRCPEFEVFFGGAAGPGKAESVTNEIPTANGWRLMAEIEPGDYVFDADGQPRCVLAVGPIQFKRPCMEVTFSDGATVVCDEQHEWMTLTYLERARASRRTEEFRSARRAKRESRALGLKSSTFTESLATRNRDRTYDLLDPPEPQVRETRELAETTMHRGRVNHSIPVAAPLVLPDVELPIDPYTLGVWLGDGYRNGGVIANDPRDDAIIQEIPYSSWRTPSNQLAVRVEGLTAMLRVAGVYGDKHIPTAYLRASAEQRLAVLQGIVDTDGHVDLRDGRVEITLTRWRLIESLCELVASLGIRFTVNESRAILDGRDVGPRWRVAFQTGLQVARLPRKRDAQHRGPFRRWHDHRYIVSVRRVPSVPVRCITVEGGIYLTGRRMIPTHNSWALLMAALQYVDVADYHALLFRPTLTEFEQQGGLIELSHKWLGPTDAAWNGTKREWRFPSRASVRFGYLRTQTHLSHYPGGGVSFLGFDELTLFTEQLYLGVFRLLRQALGGPLESVPLRVRGASNPGNVGHGWVKGRFITEDTREPDAIFVPASIRDNPSLDYETYVNTVLGHMHPVDRARLIGGDWDVMEEGGKFKRADFQLIDEAQTPIPVQQVRYWDLAATEPSPSNPDPDWTVGLLYSGDPDGGFTIRDIAMTRSNDDEVEKLVQQTASEDGAAVSIYIEQDPGQAGKAQITNYIRRVLRGYPVHAGSTRILGRPAAKEVRAAAVAAAVGNGLVRLVRCRNHREFLGQCAMFPNVGSHDDCVDALSGAHNAVTMRGGVTTISVPRGRLVQPDRERQALGRQYGVG